MTDTTDQIRIYLKAIQIGQITVSPETTHLVELFTLMKSGLGEFAETFEANYISDGLSARLRFADGKTYEITLKECRDENA